jgi:hypothetical protein
MIICWKYFPLVGGYGIDQPLLSKRSPSVVQLSASGVQLYSGSNLGGVGLIEPMERETPKLELPCLV